MEIDSTIKAIMETLLVAHGLGATPCVVCNVSTSINFKKNAYALLRGVGCITTTSGWTSRTQSWYVIVFAGQEREITGGRGNRGHIGFSFLEMQMVHSQHLRMNNGVVGQLGPGVQRISEISLAQDVKNITAAGLVTTYYMNTNTRAEAICAASSIFALETRREVNRRLNCVH